MIRFITGTDTGVGKTVAAAVLAYRARVDGLRVRYVKPVQTGLAPGVPGDAAFVASVAGIETEELLRFDEAVAPAVAAGRMGTPIHLESLTADTRLREASCDLLLVEGAGGLLSPLTGNRTMAQLAAALRAELVVATKPGLGTLNHTALTLEAADRRGLSVAGLVVCSWPERPGVAERTNLERLQAMAPVLAVVRYLKGVSVEQGRGMVLRTALERDEAIVPPGQD